MSEHTSVWSALLVLPTPHIDTHTQSKDRGRSGFWRFLTGSGSVFLRFRTHDETVNIEFIPNNPPGGDEMRTL